MPELADCEIWNAKEALENVRAIVEKVTFIISQGCSKCFVKIQYFEFSSSQGLDFHGCCR